MTHQKKKIFTILISVLIFLVVISLWPIGNTLLNIVRAQYEVYQISYSKEVIYSYIDRGDVRIADEALRNRFELSRFDPVEINNLTWNEDPFSDIYWRFNFYNLEPVRHLLFAWVKTGDTAYKDKLIEITESFIDKGMAGPYSWDNHGTAFRTMTLVDVWGKLHAKNELPVDLDYNILKALKIHGDFLVDPAHFEEDYNHGLDQAAALYLLAVNFPDMPDADLWMNIASERLRTVTSSIVDQDGVLVENSPYYHFYVLEKLWEINAYFKNNDLIAPVQLTEVISKMISYASYVLQPDLTVPTIGASLKRDVSLAGIYKEMADVYPDLLYVLTKGSKGERPDRLNAQYPISGQTILRSGWGKKNSYVNQAQLIFDVGSYNTNHSDLDALSFNLFGDGIVLMPDAGLYGYDAGPYRDYFHGTRSHNTVVVDGKDQDSGEKNIGGLPRVYAGNFEEGDGYTYQSAEHELYEGVSHERAIMMIEDSTILVLDTLQSSTTHTYEQMFHLFPGAEIDVDELTVVARDAGGKKMLTIQQFAPEGISLSAVIDEKNPVNGVCSTEYTIAIPCYAISYQTSGENTSYVTAITIGDKPAIINFDQASNLIKVKTRKNSYDIGVSESPGSERSIEARKNFDLSQIYSSIQAANSLNILEGWYNIAETEGDDLIVGAAIINTDDKTLEITTPLDGSYIEVANNTFLDLSEKNVGFKIKVSDSASLQGLDIYLSNSNWTTSTRYNITNSTYDVSRDGEWIQFWVGKGDSRKGSLGGWEKSNQPFDWARIDGIKLLVASEPNKEVFVEVKDFVFAPDQKEPRAVIVFDDGWASVLEAAKIMQHYGVKGNVGAITDSIGTKRYLTLDDLKMLQNTLGWDIVNHSSLHKDAVYDYVVTGDLNGYRKDITDALAYLIKNDINSAPNWFIYPNGRTNGIVKSIVGQYYKFARSTVDGPEIFPFAEPLEVKILSVYEDRTTLQDVHNAIQDAVKYNQTIMLMFHKLSMGAPAIYTEWQLSKFESILEDIQSQGVKIVTLSELDAENGVPETQFIVHDFVPPQFHLKVSVNGEVN